MPDRLAPIPAGKDLPMGSSSCQERRLQGSGFLAGAASLLGLLPCWSGCPAGMVASLEDLVDRVPLLKLTGRGEGGSRCLTPARKPERAPRSLTGGTKLSGRPTCAGEAAMRILHSTGTPQEPIELLRPCAI